MDAARPDEAGYELTARRNVSMTPSGRASVFVAILAVSLAISLGFTLFGAWPVLPFAGAEMLVLYLAFREMARRDGDYERVVLHGDVLTLERVERGAHHAHRFNRHWASVAVSRSGIGQPRVAVRSHGREVCFGTHLTEVQCREVARELRKRLGAR